MPAGATPTTCLQDLFERVIAIVVALRPFRTVSQQGGPRVPASPKMCPSRTRGESRTSSVKATENAYLQGVLSKLSDGLYRRPLPYHGGFRVSRAYTRDHSRHTFSCKSGRCEAVEMRRETSRVSFLMCPFCVRLVLPTPTTKPRSPWHAHRSSVLAAVQGATAGGSARRGSASRPPPGARRPSLLADDARPPAVRGS